MENEAKTGVMAGLSAAALWIVRFPGRVSRLELQYETLKDEIAEVKAGNHRVETKIDALTQTLIERL